MSVINQMLLDLEARAESGGAAETSEPATTPPAEVRAAQAPKSPFDRLPWLLGALALSGAAAAAWIGWQQWQDKKSRQLDLPPQLSLRISDALLPMPAVLEPAPDASAHSG